MAVKTDEVTQEEELLSPSQQRKENHEKAAIERKQEVERLRVAYANERTNPAFLDICNKISTFINYHFDVASQGAAYNKDGETIYLTGEQKISHVDKAAGQTEVKDYIERMLSSLPENKQT